MHINIQSITNKSQALQILVKVNDIDIICLSEHWLTRSNENLYNLDDYKWVSKYIRRNHIHGGVGILCRHEVIAMPNNEIMDKSVDMHFKVAAARIPKMNSLILCIYRSGLGDFNIFLTLLDEILNYIVTEMPPGINVVVCGDFNVQFSATSNRTQDVINTMKEANLRQTIFHPTRNDATIDNIFTNSRDYEIHQIQGNISDHEPQLLKLPINLPISEKKKTYRRRFTYNEKQNFLGALKNEEWTEVFTAKDPDDMFTAFLDTILFHYNVNIPHRLIPANKRQSRQHPELFKMRATLDLIKHSLLMEPQNREMQEVFKAYKDFYIQMCERYQKEANNDQINKALNKPKAIWKKINELTGRIALNHNQDRPSSQDLGDYFISSVRSLQENLPNISSCDSMRTLCAPMGSTFFFEPTDKYEISRIISRMKSKKTKDHSTSNH